MASQAEQQQQHIMAEETEDQEQEEEECEDDYKERRGEELSLLGHAHSLEASPAPSSRLHHWSPATRMNKQTTILAPSPHHRPLRASASSGSEVDIQIASEAELGTRGRGHSLVVSPCSAGSLRTLCGPHPAKISLVCVLVISVWLMAVLVMHLDKKLSLASETLTDTKDKLQLIQNSDASRRHETDERLHNMEQKLGSLWKLIKSGRRKSHGAQSVHSSTTTARSSVSNSSANNNNSNTTHDDFFQDDDSFWR